MRELSESELNKLILKVSENNHFMKRTIIKRWLDGNVFYCFDVKIKKIENKSSNYLYKIFTSILISQETEGLINVNEIEDNFESMIFENNLLISNKIQYVKNYKFGKKRVVKYKIVNSDKVKYIKNDKIGKKVICKYLSNYFALQLTRSPLYLYHRYESTLKCLNIDNNLEMAIYFMADMNYGKDSGFKKFYNYKLEKTKQVKSYYLFESESRDFDCSEINTIALSELFENVINYNYFQVKITKSNNLSLEILKNMYVTVISPHLLLIVNCSYIYFFDELVELIEKDIVNLWNNFTYYASIEKIVLANNKIQCGENSGSLNSFTNNKVFYSEIKNIIKSKNKTEMSFLEIIEDARKLMEKQKNNRKKEN